MNLLEETEIRTDSKTALENFEILGFLYGFSSCLALTRARMFRMLNTIVFLNSCNRFIFVDSLSFTIALFRLSSNFAQSKR